jgi:hypothetical protein
MATTAQVAEFRQANRSLVLLAQRDLRQFWESLNVLGSPDAIKNALLEFFPELLTAYGDTAAVLGADWYDMLRDVPPSVASFSALLAAPAGTEQAEGAARWALGPLFAEDPDPVSVLKNLMGSTQRLVLQPGRDSFWTSAKADPVRTGVAVIPRGGETCKFCIMLASRGAVYSESFATGFIVAGRGVDASVTAGKAGGQGLGVKARGKREIGLPKFHDDCDCEMVAIRSRDDYPEGYNRGFYQRLYEERSGYGRDIPQGGVMDTSTPMIASR